LTYLVYDEETQNHKSRKRTANPFDPRNYVVMRGWKVEGDTTCSSSYHTGKDPSNFLHIAHHVDVLVGFNLKFDLLYEMVANYDNLAAFYKRGGRVWCCQYAEFLLRAQRRKFHMCSLDQIVESYGGRKKIDGIKAHWEAGVLTADIDREMLKDYLVGTVEEGRNSGDIGNTELIYRGQVEEAKALGMYEGIKARMDGLCATTEMEYNGIMVDMKLALKQLLDLTGQQTLAAAELSTWIEHIPQEVGFNWASPIHTSCFIFGGRIKYEKQATYIDEATGKNARLVKQHKWPLFLNVEIDPARCVWSESKQMYAVKNGDSWVAQDCYVSGKKKGEPKYRKVKGWGEEKVRFQDFFYDLPGYTEGREKWKTKLIDGHGNQVYGTGKDVMDVIVKRDIPFLKVMGKYLALNKEISTYYVTTNPQGEVVGMLTCVGPDGIVHHQLNHNTVVTTRLSSSNPNMQNIPRGDKSLVKRMFVSRFPNGEMGELDYSQLEVVVQGLLSLDKNLCRDLNNKIDFHCKRVALKNGCSYTDALYWCKDETYSEFTFWKQERTSCKEFSFQVAYGAGATAISDSTGLTVDAVKGMIKDNDTAYPGVPVFNASVERAVAQSAEWFADGERGWRKFRRGQWQSPTGTIYEFRSYDAPKWLREQGVAESFSPPEMKNYPVQGTGGEVVQIALGKLWRLFVATDNFGGKALLVNTVHDCVWVDMAEGMAAIVLPAMILIMEGIPTYLKQIFGIKCPVPFPVDAEHGPNMHDLHHFNQAA